MRIPRWYRTPIAAERLRQLQDRSDFLGALQAFGYLGLIAVTGTVAVMTEGAWPWWATLACLFVHGTCFAFQINAVHELAHGTVFRSTALNAALARVFAFLGWINLPLFSTSHARHHRFTLYPPEDLEVTLPQRITLRDWLRIAVVDPGYLYRMIAEAIRLSRGRFQGEWELGLFPPDQPAQRIAPMRWARTLLIGHAAIIVAAVVLGVAVELRWLMVPVVTTFGKGYGSWLFFLCNNAQHVGMQSNVPDFRLCARTIALNPLVGFLYWNMNFHVDHHMYTLVPCYRLRDLHREIRHDLPHVHRGLLPTWREIAAIRRAAERDPAFRHDPFASNCRCAG